MTLSELAARWREDAATFDRYHDDRQASICRDHAAALEAALRESGDECVSLKQAAVLSGYSVDHLGRMITQGRLENVGRNGKPRVRRGDLPRKPSHPLRDASGEGHFSDRSAVVASVIPRRVS